jgi:hypothetical protein
MKPNLLAEAGMFPGSAREEHDQNEDFCTKRGWFNHFLDSSLQAYEAIRTKSATLVGGLLGWGAVPQDTTNERELERLVTALTIASRIAFLTEGTDSMKGLVRPVAEDGLIRDKNEAYGLLCRQLWDIENTLVHRRVEVEARQQVAVIARPAAAGNNNNDDEERIALERVEVEIAARRAAQQAMALREAAATGTCVIN